MKILVCGDRNWDNIEPIKIFITDFKADIVIEGEAKGADTLARVVAESMNLFVEKYPADWERYGLAAGPIRTSQMLIEGKPDVVIGFNNDIKKSKGTKHMLGIASRAGVPTFLYANGELKEYKG